ASALTWVDGHFTTNIASAGSRILINNVPARVAGGTCSPALSVYTVDALGIPANVPLATPVSLSSSSGTLVFYSNGGCTVAAPTTLPSASPTMGFFSDANCLNPISSVNLAANGSTVSFFAKDPNAGLPTLTASAGGFTSATQPSTVVSAPTQVAFISSPVQVGA